MLSPHDRMKQCQIASMKAAVKTPEKITEKCPDSAASAAPTCAKQQKDDMTEEDEYYTYMYQEGEGFTSIFIDLRLSVEICYYLQKSTIFFIFNFTSRFWYLTEL